MRWPDTETAIAVSTDGTSGPYIVVAPEQADAVVQALRSQMIPLDVDREAVLIDGKPALTLINLGQDADVAKVQQILDGLSTGGETGDGGKEHQTTENPNELIIRAAPTDLTEFIRRVETTPRGGWTRRAEIEQRLTSRRAIKAGAYCLAKRFDRPRSGEIAVWLQKRGPRELYVTSLIPLSGSDPLEVSAYNEVLADFEQTFLSPAADGLKVQFLTYPGSTEPKLEDLLSVSAMHLLSSFRDVGSGQQLNPIDVQRWAEFIARTHLDGSVVPPSLLGAWLEKRGWPKEQRSQLVSQYELGRTLLSAYEEERVDR